MESLPIAVIGATTSAMTAVQHLAMGGWLGQVTVWHDGELFDGLDEHQQGAFSEAVFQSGVVVVHHRHQPRSIMTFRGDVVIDGLMYGRIVA